MKAKKLLIPALIALILLLWGWHMLFRLPLLPVHPLEAVSGNMSIVFSFEDGRNFLNPNRKLSADSILGNGLTKSQWQQGQTALRRALTAIPDIKNHAFRLLFTLQNAGTGNLTASAIVDIRGKGIDLNAFIGNLQPIHVHTSNFRGTKVYRLVGQDNRSLSLSKYRNLLLIAEYPLLVEESLSRLKKTRSTLFQQQDFNSFYDKGGHIALSIFIKPENLSVLLADWLQPSGKSIIGFWGNATDWLRLDLRQEGRLTHLQGKLSAKPGDHLWAVAASQRPGAPDEMLRVIPDDVAVLQWLRISSPKKIAQIRSERLRRFVLPWAKEEMAVVRTSTAHALVFRFTDQVRMEESLEALGQTSGLLQSYDYQMYRVRQVMEERLFDGLDLPFDMPNPSFAVIGNYVVFAGSRSALEIWIDEYLVNKTLAQSSDFLRLYQQLKDEPAQLFTYINLVNLAPRVREALQTDHLLQNGQPEQSGQMAFSFTKKGNDWQIEGRWSPLMTRVASVNNASIAWKTLLDFDAITPPVPVGNDPLHPEAIAIQDSAYNLYLLNPQGDILWQKKLDGVLLSTVHSIEYYGAGTTSLLFNTAKNIYLLGMDGEPEGAFPLRLQTPATNGVTVVDFNYNRDYSFFVACSNGAVYGFDKVGRPLSGWNPLRGVGEVRHPLLHFQYRNRDYLSVLNEQGHLLVYQRDGDFHFTPKDFGVSSLSPLDYELSQKSNRIVAGDQEGFARIIGMDGSIFKLRLLSGASEPVQFAFADITGDERKDYIALSGNLLTVHGYNQLNFRQLFQYDFDAPQDEMCAVPVPGWDKSVTGVVSKAKRQIHLLDAEGKIFPGFPLGGNTRFLIADLFGNGQQILVVANSDSVYAYRIYLKSK